MSAEMENTLSNASSTRESGTISSAVVDILKNVAIAGMDTPLILVEKKEGEGKEERGERGRERNVRRSRLLASGGYNDVWLVEMGFADGEGGGEEESKNIVVRQPNSDALMPNQLENEVAWLTYVAEHTSIRVPKVYSWSSADPPYVTMEYVEGRPMCDVWKDCDEDEKELLVKEIARMVVELGEIGFDKIGGLSPEHQLAPTVEGMKLFKGRDKIHSDEHYEIGPYSTVKKYALACYDKEIYYYSKAPFEDIVWRLFEKDEELTDDDQYNCLPDDGPRRETLLENKAAFVEELKEARKECLQDEETFSQEPFVLCHNDLNGRNIMVRDKHIVGIIDWEFAGSYPLSELLSGGSIDVIEYLSEEDQEENFKWHVKIRDAIQEATESRGWSNADKDLLFNDGTGLLPGLRTEMIPNYLYDEDEGDDVSDHSSDVLGNSD
ncbi:uncharacterized protein KY384_005222 [Bacidia gigantensis]|uniref:uncharacterized protein n=1 Tax=Bacidia gigantensis TaxID=2732470 RepID=UPI001D04FF00|nr:uncharacterized protein KY384_005222 [Bacidia gigantensis]KAG8529741.1 hypothetical protein KY384_005222 [Bacidia gigantensis]